ncbi:hypothetical protein DASC09_002130 [Saccharomycopsis crataegensis]|uniref:Zn(2)-C6 fungal-type domain-containing protein n=1 Tax=Saccharomycopsis crataegensis TaxID=43959 RepID=A0AAV5QDR0_9ASCO|nr:hypothetical protein DASC09_002130 [Saccharomycopsis crataegensis]
MNGSNPQDVLKSNLKNGLKPSVNANPSGYATPNYVFPMNTNNSNSPGSSHSSNSPYPSSMNNSSTDFLSNLNNMVIPNINGDSAPLHLDGINMNTQNNLYEPSLPILSANHESGKRFEEKEPLSLDSLELPEIAMTQQQSGEVFVESNNVLKRNNSGSISGGQKPIKKSRFKPCDGCRKRKTKCVIPENKRSCVECTKRNQPCEYDSKKIFLFNNINSLSGTHKLMKADSKLPSQLTIEKDVKKNTSGGKSHRAKPCEACKKKRSKCIRSANSSSCVECEKRNTICTYPSSLINSFPVIGKVSLLTNNNETAIEKPVKDYSLLREPTVMSSSLSLLSSKSATIIGECSIVDKKLLDFKTEDSNTISLIKSPISEVEDDNTIIRKLNEKTFFQIADDVDEFTNLKYLQCDEIEELVGKNSNYLLNIYFKLVHPTLPILSKEVFYERYCRNYREIHPLLLVTIYLLALNWWELDVNEFDVLGRFSSDETFAKSAEKPNIMKLESIATALMQDNLYEAPKFSFMQALLLLSNYNFLSNNNPFSTGSYWKISSMMTTFSEEIGLNWPSADWDDIPLWERKVRKIVSWAVVFHDKLYSLFDGRSSNIDLENNWMLDEFKYNDFLIDTESLMTLEKNDLMSSNKMFNLITTESALNGVELKEEDTEDVDLGKDSDNKFISKLIFIETMNLSSRMDEILVSIYSLKSLRFDDFDTIYGKSVPLVENLKNWFKSLPESIKLVHRAMNNNSNQQDIGSLMLVGGKKSNYFDYKSFSLLSNGSLNLLYYTLVLLIYKRIVSKYIDVLESYLSSPDKSSLKIKTEEIVDKLKKVKPEVKDFLKCIIYNFLFNLKPYNLESFWLLNTRRSFIFIGVILGLLVKTVNLEITKARIIRDQPQSPNDTQEVQDQLVHLEKEKQEFIAYYRDFHWKLTTMAPDFNHARVALRYLDDLVVIKDDYQFEKQGSYENGLKRQKNHCDREAGTDDDNTTVEPPVFSL